MRKLKNVTGFALSIALMTLVLSCPPDSGEPEGPGTGDDFEMPDTTKKTILNRRVYMEIWGEPEVDPRNAIGYQLEDDGTPFFDRYIVLYGGRIINNDCVNRPRGGATNCVRQGLHLHYDDDVYEKMWGQADTVIKPLRQAGIRVLMGLVPKDGGACIGVMYEWPMEPVWPWEAKTGEPYPYGEEAVERLQEQIITDLNKFGLDGVGYDEEYGNSAAHSGQLGLGSVYPSYSGQGNYTWTSGWSASNAWKKGGENIFRFAYNLAKKKPGILQDVYEIRYGSYIPPKMTIEGKEVKVTDVFGISYEPTYGGWQAKSGIGMPNEFYGPGSIDICSGIQPTALPPYGRNGITARANQILDDKYGVMMYYCLRSSDEMAARLPRYYGEVAGYNTAEYLSSISTVLFGQRTVYKGASYPRLW